MIKSAKLLSIPDLKWRNKLKKVLLKIDGMTCSACSTGLEKYLNKQEGVKATVNLVMNNANIEYDENKYDISDLEKFVAKAGFISLGIDKLEIEEKKKTKEKYILIGITVISLLILYISMSHMVGLPVIPFLDMMKYPINYAISLWVLSSIVIFLGKDMIKPHREQVLKLYKTSFLSMWLQKEAR